MTQIRFFLVALSLTLLPIFASAQTEAGFGREEENKILQSFFANQKQVLRKTQIEPTDKKSYSVLQVIPLKGDPLQFTDLKPLMDGQEKNFYWASNYDPNCKLLTVSAMPQEGEGGFDQVVDLQTSDVIYPIESGVAFNCSQYAVAKTDESHFTEEGIEIWDKQTGKWENAFRSGILTGKALQPYIIAKDLNILSKFAGANPVYPNYKNIKWIDAGHVELSGDFVAPHDVATFTQLLILKKDKWSLGMMKIIFKK